MGKIKSILKRALLPYAVATSLLGGTVQAKPEREQSVLGLTINVSGEGVRMREKADEFERKYQKETIVYDAEHSTDLYSHSPERFSNVKEAFKKLPINTQKHIYKVFFCHPEDYKEIAPKRGTGGFVMDNSMFINGDEKLERDLEHIILHECAHVHERLIDEVSNKDEKNEDYKEYFKLKEKKREKELTASLMGLPEISNKFRQEAKEIDKKMSALKNIPPSHYLDKEWEEMMAGYDIPEAIQIQDKGFTWKAWWDKSGTMVDELNKRQGEYSEADKSFNEKYKDYQVNSDSFKKKLVDGSTVSDEELAQMNAIRVARNGDIEKLQTLASAYNDLHGDYSAFLKESGAPRCGFVTPYSTTSHMEDRADTASFVMSRPEVVRAILHSTDVKAAELMGKKLGMLHKYGFIDSASYQNLMSK